MTLLVTIILLFTFYSVHGCITFESITEHIFFLFHMMTLLQDMEDLDEMKRK